MVLPCQSHVQWCIQMVMSEEETWIPLDLFSKNARTQSKPKSQSVLWEIYRFVIILRILKPLMLYFNGSSWTSIFRIICPSTFCWILKLLRDLSETCFVVGTRLIQHSALIASVPVSGALVAYKRWWPRNPTQTVYQGSGNVELSNRNVLKCKILGQNLGICEIWSQNICQCVRACFVFLSITPLPYVSNLHHNIHKPHKQKLWSITISAWSHSLTALVCHETLSLYLPLLLRPKPHFLHAYNMLIWHLCMPQGTTVPEAVAPGTVIYVSHLFLG